MRRSTDTSQILVRHIVYLVEIFRANEVFVWHNTLDGCDNKLVADASLEFLEMILEVWRWGYEYERIVVLHYLVDIGREENLIYVESCRHQIGGVMPHALEVFDAVIATHIPAYVMSMPHHNLGYCRSPATAANNSNFSAVEHFVLCLMYN